jgi:hypothetical protein
MGKETLVDKTIVPQETGPMPQQVGGLTVAQALQQGLGVYILGGYKGQTVFVDLDKLVNQPLVRAEQEHILGILDGREEDYDLQTITTTLFEAVGTVHTAQITVPAGVVWFLNAVELVVPASGGANAYTANWRSSLWKDRAAVPSPNGQPFHAVDFNPGVGGGTQWDEFGQIPLLWTPTNKPVSLRLPAGTVLTFSFTNTLAVAAAAVNCIARVYGYIGKALVV